MKKKTCFTFPRAESVYAIDSKWLEPVAPHHVDALVEAYPEPYDMPDLATEASPDEVPQGAVVELPSLYGWDVESGDLMAIRTPERVGLRCCYDSYGQLIGAANAGVAFGFSEAFAAKGMQMMMDRVEDVSVSIYDRTVETLGKAIERGGAVTWYAYDEPGLWDLFAMAFSGRFEQLPSYDDGEVWVEDTPVDAVTYWDNSNFRTLFVGGLGSEHEDAGINTDIEVASPTVQLWANTVATMCAVKAGQVHTGVIAYTRDGKLDTYPRKMYSQWAGTGWFWHWIEWAPLTDEE